jgi:hypothetical protein
VRLDVSAFKCMWSVVTQLLTSGESVVLQIWDATQDQDTRMAWRLSSEAPVSTARWSRIGRSILRLSACVAAVFAVTEFLADKIRPPIPHRQDMEVAVP